MQHQILLLLLLAGFQSFAVNVAFSELSTSNTIKSKFTSTGGHMGDCLSVYISNKNDYPVHINVPSGLRFASIDTNAQDIIIIREDILALNPHEKATFTLFGFCTQLKKSSPAAGGLYKLEGEVPERMKELCHLLDSLKDLSKSDQQSAVWVLSDNKPLSTVFSKFERDDSPLYEFLCAATGQEPTWYRVKYLNNGTRYFAERPIDVGGQFSFTPTENGVASIILYDRNGSAVHNLTLDENVQVADGAKTYPFSWKPKNRKIGTYILCVYLNGNKVRTDEIVI